VENTLPNIGSAKGWLKVTEKTGYRKKKSGALASAGQGHKSLWKGLLKGVTTQVEIGQGVALLKL
jgi:hypothetical protein